MQEWYNENAGEVRIKRLCQPGSNFKSVSTAGSSIYMYQYVFDSHHIFPQYSALIMAHPRARQVDSDQSGQR
jgi:hypothetical protein